MVDSSGGFAGVAADFLEAVGDEYNRNPQLLFSLRPPWTTPAVSHRDAVVASLHESVSLARLSSLSNLLIPAGLQQLASSELRCDIQPLVPPFDLLYLDSHRIVKVLDRCYGLLFRFRATGRATEF